MTTTMSDDINEGSDSGDIDPTISDEMLRLFHRATEARTREERTEALLELAERFSTEHDETDFTATDDWHAYIEEYIRAKLAFRQAALRLGRLAVNTLEVHFEENDISSEEVARRGHRSLN